MPSQNKRFVALIVRGVNDVSAFIGFGPPNVWYSFAKVVKCVAMKAYYTLPTKTLLAKAENEQQGRCLYAGTELPSMLVLKYSTVQGYRGKVSNRSIGKSSYNC